MAVAILVAFQLGSMRGASEGKAVGSVSIRVVVVQPGENRLLREENVEIFAGTTVFEVLDRIADVGYKEYPGLGKFVVSIDNVEQTTDRWWLYQVNGIYPNIAADRYMVADGDNILWKFTSEWPTF
ncbi:MAG: DUF4430 domain-containing protein [Hadesarchaea archaeon]|nr:DUF4430 domain-containing protein [Hadesarchaea archaeon]